MKLEPTDRGFALERLPVAAAASATVDNQQRGGDRMFVFNGIKNASTEAGKTLDYRVPRDAFGHTNNGAIVQLEAAQSSGVPLPDWIDFDPTSGTFSGRPPADASGTIEIKVTARDDQGREVTSSFQLTVNPAAAELGQKPAADAAAPINPEQPVPATSAENGERDADGMQPIRLSMDKAAPPKRGAIPFSDQLKLSKRDPLVDRILAGQPGAHRSVREHRLAA